MACGYSYGNSASPCLPAPGFNCRVDTVHNLWGFCPTTVIAATDCGLAGFCIDDHNCKSGCGPFAGVSSITTFTCSGSLSHCSFLYSVVNGNVPRSSFPYIACGDKAATDTMFAVPTVDATTTMSTSISSSTVAPTSSPSSKIASSTSTSASTNTSNSTVSITSAMSAVASQTSITSAVSAVASQATSSTSDKETSTPLGAILGGALGGIAIICLTVIALLLLRRHRNKAGEPPSLATPHELHNYRESAYTAGRASKYPPPYQHAGGWAPAEVSEVNNDPIELSGTGVTREMNGYNSPRR